MHMAQQQVEEGGWPLGLQPLNPRSRTHAFSGSISFTTLLTPSPSSLSDSSSDLDTQSTGSFFHDHSITLGNLMGVSSIVELSRRSLRRGKMGSQNPNSNPKSKPWCFGFCLCRRGNMDDIDVSKNNAMPLGHFLEVERRAAQDHRRGQQSPLIYGADELALAQPFGESSNSLFADGRIVPPTRSSPWSDSDTNRKGEGKRFKTPCF